MAETQESVKQTGLQTAEKAGEKVEEGKQQADDTARGMDERTAKAVQAQNSQVQDFLSQTVDSARSAMRSVADSLAGVNSK